MTGGSLPDANRDEEVADLLASCLARQQAGEPVDVERLLQEHPGLAAELREGLTLLGEIDAAIDEEERPPGVLGDYRILREVGRGGMGVVYEAEQVSLGRRVALKVLPFAGILDERQVQRFQNEARAAALLQHPGIVPVHAVGCERGMHYYVMQFIAGQSLKDFIQELRGRRADPGADRTTSSAGHCRSAAQLILEAAEALDYAHQLGVVHRDIKPGNLLLDGGGRLWVADFGVAQIQRDAALTLSGEVLGTLGYGSPEQASGQRQAVDHRTDIYSLGATLYELLTLEPPHAAGDTRDLIRKVLLEEPRPPRRLNPAIPSDLETIVLTALAKDLRHRYASAGALAGDLRAFLEGRPILARRASAPERVWRWCGRNRGLSITAAVAGLALLLAALAGRVAMVLREQNARVEKAEADAKVSSALMESRARRLSGEIAWREESLAVLKGAADLLSGIELEEGERHRRIVDLRSEAIAALAGSDVRVERVWDAPTRGQRGLAMSPSFEVCARIEPQGKVSVRRLEGDEELALLEGKEYPQNFEFSPDGRFLIVLRARSNADPHELRAWDWQRRESIFAPEKKINWRAFCFAGAGRLLACFTDGSLVASELETAEVSVDLPPDPALAGAFVLRFQDNLKRIATVCGDGRTVILRGLEGGAPSLTLRHPHGVEDLAWDPRGRYLAAASHDQKVYVWDPRSRDLLRTLSVHLDPVVGLAASPDGDLLGSTGWDGVAWLSEPLSGKARFRLKPPNYHAFVFSRDGSLVGPGLSGASATVWRLLPSPVHRVLRYVPRALHTSPFSASLRGDGRLLATGSYDGLRLWDLRSGRELAFVEGYARSALFHPTAGDLISTGDQGVKRWPVVEIGPGRLRIGPPRLVARLDRAHWAVLAADGRRLFVTVGRSGFSVPIHEIDLESGEGRVLTDRHASPSQFDVSPDGRRLARFGQGQGGASIIDFESGRVQLEAPGDGSMASFSPDGRLLALSAPPELRIVETATGKLHLRIERDLGGLVPAFTPDGRVIAVPRGGTRIELHDLDTGREIARLEPPYVENLHRLRFSADGSLLYLTSGQQSVHLWDLRALRRELRRIHLDWDLPAFPPEAAREGPEVLEVDLVLGPEGPETSSATPAGEGR